ncbi:hypothetical protein Z042_14370 [Chania multitudinisentens RB-25]|uniref:ADP-heptose--LPS heptosyltransferase n=1 Tax=Chania multitudinisentens RB-25 TaxID=1441930 RepID=W0LEG7_9GAMM|nr:hypothetical protein [Chania multitudinisentens]AHG20667.2 hypothetical protein Z042_14370 [Chania multitudinisentens RB-25]
MNKLLLEHNGSLLLEGKFIVSPYGAGKISTYGKLTPLEKDIIHNNSKRKIKVNYKDIKNLTIINGMGVTLGDSIVGINALYTIKKLNNDINIRVIRPELCPSYVNDIYLLSKNIIDTLSYMPFDIEEIPHTQDSIIIDIGNQLYWKDFSKKEMHDFFLYNLGVNPKEIEDCEKSNYWLKDVELPEVSLGDYVLFCPDASTKIRSIPSRFHQKIVEELSKKHQKKIMGFTDIEHDNYINIKALSKKTENFISIVKNSKYLYTCDSSALHIGAGFEIPTTCIFTTVRPTYRSFYYKNCESYYIGTFETDGIHNSENANLIKLIESKFEEFYV